MHTPMPRVLIILLLLVFVGACQSTAVPKEKLSVDARWVELKTDRGETVRALYAAPKAPGKHAAVIFNHGTGVRMMGYQQAVASGNMDVKDYVADGPIRRRSSNSITPAAINGSTGCSKAIGGTCRRS